MSQLVPFGKAAETFPILVKDATGQLVNADVLPTVLNVQVNGVDALETTVTIAQAQDATPAAIAGMYIATVNLTTLAPAVNDTIAIVVQATVGGTIATDVFTFTVADLAGAQPTVDIGG